MRLIRKLITAIKKGFYKLMDKTVEIIKEEAASKIAKWTFIKDAIASVFRTVMNSNALRTLLCTTIIGSVIGLGVGSTKLLVDNCEREKKANELAELDHRIAVQEKMAVLNKEETKNAQSN